MHPPWILPDVVRGEPAEASGFLVDAERCESIGGLPGRVEKTSGRIDREPARRLFSGSLSEARQLPGLRVDSISGEAVVTSIRDVDEAAARVNFDPRVAVRF